MKPIVVKILQFLILLVYSSLIYLSIDYISPYFSATLIILSLVVMFITVEACSEYKYVSNKLDISNIMTLFWFGIAYVRYIPKNEIKNDYYIYSHKHKNKIELFVRKGLLFQRIGYMFISAEIPKQIDIYEKNVINNRTNKIKNVYYNNVIYVGEEHEIKEMKRNDKIKKI